jgi:chemotaxis protein MotB
MGAIKSKEAKMNGIRLQVAGAVLAAALAASGCVSKGEFEKLEADKASEQKQRVALEQQTRELQSQRKALEDQKALLERQQGDLRGQLATLAQQKAQLEAANQQTKSQYDGLVSNLTEEVKKGQLQVRQYKDMLTVEVAEQLFFDSGKAALKDSGKEVLKKVGEALKGYEDKIIRVVGHTDNVPIATSQFPSNWELSAARATTVVRFLQSTGIPPERMTASGRGEYSPIAANDDADGRRKNRRIEITLVDRNLAQEIQEKERR